MRVELIKKIDQSIRLLKSIPQDKGDVELCYSGGKDSDVILELAKMSKIKFRPIYKNTTIDPIGTIRHCLDNGVEIARPQETFFQLIRRKGFPSRSHRFCCEKLKEYKICDTAIQGIRKSEIKKRDEIYDEPQICRTYNNRKDCVSVFLPILNWTNEDVEEFIKERAIDCHPLYYRGGAFDVKCRLGCIGCPLAYRKRRIKEFKDNPGFVRQWIRNGQIYYDNHQNGQKLNNAVDAFAFTLFFDSFREFESASNTMFGKTDWRTYLEDYFNVDLDDIHYE